MQYAGSEWHHLGMHRWVPWCLLVALLALTAGAATIATSSSRSEAVTACATFLTAYVPVEDGLPAFFNAEAESTSLNANGAAITLVGTLRAFKSTLSNDHWPTRARVTIHELIRTDSVLRDDLESLANGSNNYGWYTESQSDAGTLEADANDVEVLLGVEASSHRTVVSCYIAQLPQIP